MRDNEAILRVGGVGTGRIFQHAHLRVYPKMMEQAWLTGFFDLNPVRAAQANEKYAEMLRQHAEERPEDAEAVRNNLAAMRCYDSLEAMLDDVDVIDVATHARGRMAAAIAALERDVHVMVEKPMARTWTEADRAARVAAGRPGVFLQLNDDNAFDPKYRILHDLIQSGAIGKPQHVSLIRGSRLDHTSVLKSQASAMDNGGGCLMDYGSHGLAGVWAALGLGYRPVTVEAARIAVLFPHRVLEGEPTLVEVDDNAQIKVLFEEAATGSWVTVFLEATWCGGHIGIEKEKSGGQSNGYVHIVGDKGVIHTNDGARIDVRGWDGGETVLPLREYAGETVSFDTQVGGFFHDIRTSHPPEIDVNFGAEIMAICGAAYLSAIRGRSVTLDEFKEFSRGYVERFGDGEQADDALVTDLLTPYRYR